MTAATRLCLLYLEDVCRILEGTYKASYELQLIQLKLKL